jgi:hypothetical protein
MICLPYVARGPAPVTWTRCGDALWRSKKFAGDALPKASVPAGGDRIAADSLALSDVVQDAGGLRIFCVFTDYSQNEVCLGHRPRAEMDLPRVILPELPL